MGDILTGLLIGFGKSAQRQNLMDLEAETERRNKLRSSWEFIARHPKARPELQQLSARNILTIDSTPYGKTLPKEVNDFTPLSELTVEEQQPPRQLPSLPMPQREVGGQPIAEPPRQTSLPQFLQPPPEMVKRAGFVGPEEEAKQAEQVMRTRARIQLEEHDLPLERERQKNQPESRPRAPETIDTPMGRVQWNTAQNRWEPVTVDGKPVGPKPEKPADLSMPERTAQALLRKRSGAQTAEDEVLISMWEQQHRPPQATNLYIPGLGLVSKGTGQLVAKIDVPTSATRTMIEAAPKVIGFIDRTLPLIDKQAANLGPLASRWNEFMAGSVGSPNPEFTKLRTNVMLLSTLLLRMHVGARGGESMRQHFIDLMDTAKQSPENLKAALTEVRQYAQDVQSSGGTEAPAAPPPPPGSDNPYRKR